MIFFEHNYVPNYLKKNLFFTKVFFKGHSPCVNCDLVLEACIPSVLSMTWRLCGQWEVHWGSVGAGRGNWHQLTPNINCSILPRPPYSLILLPVSSFLYHPSCSVPPVSSFLYPQSFPVTSCILLPSKLWSLLNPGGAKVMIRVINLEWNLGAELQNIGFVNAIPCKKSCIWETLNLQCVKMVAPMPKRRRKIQNLVSHVPCYMSSEVHPSSSQCHKKINLL